MGSSKWVKGKIEFGVVFYMAIAKNTGDKNWHFA